MSYKVKEKNELVNYDLIELNCLMCNTVKLAKWFDGDTLSKVCKRNDYNAIIVDKHFDVICDECKFRYNLYDTIKNTHQLIHNNA